MIISHKHRFIFIKTRKTAGTSLDIALSEHCGPQDIITKLPPEDEQIRRELGYRGPQNFRWPLWAYRPHHIADYFRKKRPLYRQHLNASDVIRHVGQEVWDNYFTFTIEREPYGKAISRYWWSTRDQNPRPSLENYLEGMRTVFLSNWDFYTINDQIVVDKILRFENLQDELKMLEEKLGIGPIVMPRAKGNYRKDTRHYSQILSPSARQRIELVCAKEIRQFGYQWEEVAEETPAIQIPENPNDLAQASCV